MNKQSLLNTLREMRFLYDVEDQYLEQIAAVARLVEFPVGKVIFREGEPFRQIYLIESGSVSLEIAAPGVGPRRIHTVSQGELLGWSPVLEQARITATARTLCPTTAVEINAGQMITLCEHNPRFGYEFMRRVALALARRLHATRLQLLDIYGYQMPPALDR